MGFNPEQRCGRTGGVAADDQSWEHWLERLYNLRRDKRGSHERPHQPVLILSIIDLLDRSEIWENAVPICIGGGGERDGDVRDRRQGDAILKGACAQCGYEVVRVAASATGRFLAPAMGISPRTAAS
jgi:hypothetical protein